MAGQSLPALVDGSSRRCEKLNLRLVKGGQHDGLQVMAQRLERVTSVPRLERKPFAGDELLRTLSAQCPDQVVVPRFLATRRVIGTAEGVLSRTIRPISNLRQRKNPTANGPPDETA